MIPAPLARLTRSARSLVSRVLACGRRTRKLGAVAAEARLVHHSATREGGLSQRLARATGGKPTVFSRPISRSRLNAFPPRVQNVSTFLREFEAGLSPIEQSDRVFRCRLAEVHVALRRRQVRVSSELLDGPCRRALHRQVRTERVPKDVHALVDARDALSAPDGFDHAIARDRRPIRETQARSDRRCRAALSAAVRRCVIGNPRDRPPFGTVRCPSHSDRCTVSRRALSPTSRHSSAMISPSRKPASPPSSTIRHAWASRFRARSALTARMRTAKWIATAPRSRDSDTRSRDARRLPAWHERPRPWPRARSQTRLDLVVASRHVPATSASSPPARPRAATTGARSPSSTTHTRCFSCGAVWSLDPAV
jgi:hypothetical protein